MKKMGWALLVLLLTPGCKLNKPDESAAKDTAAASADRGNVEPAVEDQDLNQSETGIAAALPSVAGFNLLQNSFFAEDLTGWSLETYESASGVLAYDKGLMVYRPQRESEQPWYVQIVQELAVERGQSYQPHIVLADNFNGQLDIALQRVAAPYEVIAVETVKFVNGQMSEALRFATSYSDTAVKLSVQVGLLAEPLVVRTIQLLVAADPAIPAAKPNCAADNLNFLLLGQSNMAGSDGFSAEDQIPHTRVQMLGIQNTNGYTYNEWAPAIAPMHYYDRPDMGVGIGDRFGRMLANSLPHANVRLVPAAMPGAPIQAMMKGVRDPFLDSFFLPPDNTFNSGYDFILDRARKAQENGETIDAILFHQGEFDNGRDTWSDDALKLFADLKADLGLVDVPIILGQLYDDDNFALHLPEIREVVLTNPDAHFVSSTALAEKGDQIHFTQAAYREFGERYARKFLDIYGPKDCVTP